jgi:peroxiredoxin family protein
MKESAHFKPIDFHLWIGGELQSHWNACEALALRAAIGIGAEVFIAGDAVHWCRKSIDPSEFSATDRQWLAEWKKLQILPEQLIVRARQLGKVHLTACNLSLEIAGLKRHELAAWVDDVAGAASFWQRLPLGAAPMVF